MKIEIRETGSNYKTDIDTGVNDVLITELFIGPVCTSTDGERIAYCQRDSGFELTYKVPFLHALEVRFNDGQVSVDGVVVAKAEELHPRG